MGEPHDATNNLWIQAGPAGIIGTMKDLGRVLLAVLVAASAAIAAEPGRKLKILATVFPLREFAAGVVGDRGEAAMLLGAAQGPNP